MAASDNKSEKKPAAPKKAASKAASAAKKPGVKKDSAAKKTVAAKKPAAAKKAAAPKITKLSAEERYRMTEVAAYFMAERNKFAGNPIDYWSAAEAQIGQMLAKK